MDIDEFPSGVIEHLGWYIYRLIDSRDGSTLYVGKGKGNRISAHICGGVMVVDDDELLNSKFRQLREIRLAGLDVIHAIHQHGTAEEKTVYGVETALIDAYPGLANIMDDASSSEFGVIYIKELITTYQSETIMFQHKALVIPANGNLEDIDLHGVARSSRHVSVDRVHKAGIILATIRGIMRGIYTTDGQFKSTRENFPKMTSWEAGDEFEVT